MEETETPCKCSHASEKITKNSKNNQRKFRKNKKIIRKNSEKVPWKKQKHHVNVPVL